jgi:hypothetical protein
MAVVHHEPHVGKSRLGGGFLRDDDVYHRIFDPDIALSVFSQSVKLAHMVEHRMRSRYSEAKQSGAKRRDSMRYLFPTVMLLSLVFGPVGEMDFDELTPDVIDSYEDLCVMVDGDRISSSDQRSGSRQRSAGEAAAVDRTSRRRSGRRWRGKGGLDVQFAAALLAELPNWRTGGGADAADSDCAEATGASTEQGAPETATGDNDERS